MTPTLRERADEQQILPRLRYALDCMKGRLTERPTEEQDRCVLCGWTRVDGAKDGNCGRTAGCAKDFDRYGITKDWSGKHLWFTDLLTLATTVAQQQREAMLPSILDAKTVLENMVIGPCDGKHSVEQLSDAAQRRLTAIGYLEKALRTAPLVTETRP